MEILNRNEHGKTIENLMRAFAGESQARNRYEMAAGRAKKESLPVIEAWRKSARPRSPIWM